MMTIVLILFFVLSLLLFGMPVVSLAMPAEHKRYRLMLAPIAGFAAYVLVTQFVAIFGFTGKSIALAGLVPFVGLWIWAAIAKKIDFRLKGAEATPLVFSIIIVVIGAWPLFVRGYDTYMAFVNPDAVTYVSDTHYLQDHSFQDVPRDQPYRPYLQWSMMYAESHRRIGAQFAMLYMSQATGIGYPEAFNIVSAVLLFLFPVSVFLFARIGVELPEKAALTAAALASLASLTPFSFLSQSIGSISASVLLPVGLAFVPRSLSGRDRLYKIMAVLSGAGLYYAYFPVFPFLVVPALLYAIAAAYHDRSLLKQNLLLAIFGLVALIAVNPVHFYEVLKLTINEAVGSRLSISLSGDELLLGYAYTLTEQYLPVFWGMAYYPFSILMPLAQSITFALALLVLGFLVLILMVIALVRYRKEYNAFLVYVLGANIVVLVLEFLGNNGYGLLKLAIWLEYLKVTLIAIVIFTMVRRRASGKLAMFGRAAILLSISLYVLFNLYSTFQLTTLTIKRERGTPYVNWAEFPSRGEIDSLSTEANALSKRGSVLIGLQQILPQWWSQYFLREARISILEPVQLSPSNRRLNVSPPHPATDRYLLSWFDPNYDIVRQKNGRTLWMSRHFRIYDLDSVYNFLFPGIRWYTVEGKDTASDMIWKRFRWARDSVQLIILKPTADSLRLKMTLWAGYGLRNQKRTIDLLLNGQNIATFSINGMATYISPPFRSEGMVDTLTLAIREEAFPIPRDWGLWNLWVPKDSRRLNIGATNLTLLTTADHAELAYPHAIDFTDTGHELSPEYNGITPDRWVLDTAVVALSSPPGATKIRIKGEMQSLPGVPIPEFSLRINNTPKRTITLPRFGIFDTVVTIGAFSSVSRVTRITFIPSGTFIASSRGTGKDYRTLGFRLESVGFIEPRKSITSNEGNQ